MNPFNKNPFANTTTNTKIITKTTIPSEKQKLDNIRENMTKLKFPNQPQQEQPQKPVEQTPQNPQNLRDRMDFLRKLDK